MSYNFTTKATYQQYFSKAHDMVRQSIKEFVDKEIRPHVDSIHTYFLPGFR
jgi:hypothetical protein